MLAGSYLLASTLNKFISVYKSANITVINGPYDALVGKLRAGWLDFLVGLLKNPAPADDGAGSVCDRRPHGPSLANKKEITGGDLVGLDWILAPSLACASRRIAFENTFRGLAGPHTNVEIHSLPAITSILANSDRSAILTQSELEVACQQGQRLKALNFGPIEPSTGRHHSQGLASDLFTAHVPRVSARADKAAGEAFGPCLARRAFRCFGQCHCTGLRHSAYRSCPERVNGGGRAPGRERQQHPSKPTTSYFKVIISCVPLAEEASSFR
jgi:hypothetical protein